jgi:integrase
MSGHIRRSGKASWELKFSVDRKPQYRSFKGTKRAAVAELTRLTASAINGTYVDGSKLTLAEFLGRWMRDWAEVHNSPKTQQNNAQLIRGYIMPNSISAVPLQKLKPLHLSELYAKLLREGGSNGTKLSATTVGNVHRVLKNALRHAVRWGLILKTPAADISPPRNDSNEIDVAKRG